jgi:hypothetical protein
MPFSERTKLNVKRKADFSCCWCEEREHRIQVHHIIPECEDGSNDEDNAAPLCASHHDLLGGNPELRKAVREKRDHWYEIVSKRQNPEYGWPMGLDVPLLEYYREAPPTIRVPSKGIEFSDREPNDPKNPPLLYLSVYFKRTRYFGQSPPQSNDRWLYLEAHMRFAFSLRIQVRAWNERDVLEFLEVLREDTGGYDLHGPAPESNRAQPGDYLLVWHEERETRLIISTFTATNAGISIHARLSNPAASALADYLEEAGFTKPFLGSLYRY